MATKQNNLFTALVKDIFTGWSKGEAVYAWALIALQIVTFIFNPDSVAGFITGLTGTICVLLVAKRKLSNYAFGFIQTAIGLYLGLSVRLWGESLENGYYFIMQIVGYLAWRKHMVSGTSQTETEQVATKKFGVKQWVASFATIAAGTAVLGYVFGLMNGTQPYVDAATLVVAVVAQAIMNFRYREQWIFWFALNIISIVQWWTLGNASMVALYAAFIINNAYGYYQWTKGAE